MTDGPRPLVFKPDLTNMRSVRPGDYGPVSPATNDLLEFWYRGRGSSSLPDRESFDPLNLRRWIGHLSIYEHMDANNDFLNRLEGTETHRLTGECWQGRFASDVDARFGTNFLRDLRQVVDDERPSWGVCTVFQRPGLIAERVLLPIVDRRRGRAQVFVALLPFEGMDSATVYRRNHIAHLKAGLG